MQYKIAIYCDRCQRSVVCIMSVGWAHGWALQKRLNPSPQ